MTQSRIFLLVLLLCALTPLRALDASIDYRGAEDALRGYFRDLEVALNNREDALEKIHVLHDGIRADARFDVRVDRSGLLPALGVQSMHLGKDGYINSFLLSGDAVQDYRASVQVVAIEAGETGYLSSTILLTEEGQTFSASKQGKLFVSYTVCRSQHARNLQILSSVCDTSVQYPKNI